MTLRIQACLEAQVALGKIWWLDVPRLRAEVWTQLSWDRGHSHPGLAPPGDRETRRLRSAWGSNESVGHSAQTIFQTALKDNELGNLRTRGP